MDVVVQKYGGSSVENIERIKYIAKRIIAKKQEKKNLVVVVSAMGNTTNKLVCLSKEVSNIPDKRELDVLLSTGEQQTASLLSMVLKELGCDSISLMGYQAKIYTEGEHTRSTIKDIDKSSILRYLKQGKVVIVPGFQGIDNKGDITTLGRGGSDITAVALAGRLNCKCEIYTDVEGIYSVDPRIFPNGKKIEYIDYNEMLSLSASGTKVLDKRAIKLAKQYNVPIYLASSFTDKKGTFIGEVSKVEESKITGLSIDENCILINILNVANDEYKIINFLNALIHIGTDINIVNISNISSKAVNVSFICSKDDYGLIDSIEGLIYSEINSAEFVKDEDSMKITLIGTGINQVTDYHSRILKIFFNNNISIKQMINTEFSISYIINKTDKNKFISDIIEEFNL
ncbi:MAG: aspartate kinase [Clostridiaceae bacterium]|nr:aspartate kinase [Clostridiaceae bacterium]MBW4859299.1 aspartate kinase [Clostridiaceae bacterium]MBW4868756.1 aspartate kinase [Clostridiaceae bacterium]